MQIIKRNPDSGWALPSGWASVLDDFCCEWPTTYTTQNRMPLNVREDDKAYLLSMAAPGLTRDNFTIEVEDDVLTIHCEKKENKEDKSNDFLHKEFNYVNSNRSVCLPKDGIHTGKIKAHYEQGVLHVELPKKEQTRQVKKITIS